MEHSNEQNSADERKQDIKNSVGTVRPHRTKAGGFLGESEQKYFEKI